MFSFQAASILRSDGSFVALVLRLASQHSRAPEKQKPAIAVLTIWQNDAEQNDGFEIVLPSIVLLFRSGSATDLVTA